MVGRRGRRSSRESGGLGHELGELRLVLPRFHQFYDLGGVSTRTRLARVVESLELTPRVPCMWCVQLRLKGLSVMPMRTTPCAPLANYLPICSLPRQHESCTQYSIRVGLREGVDRLRKPRQSITAVLKGHLANHGATSDAGKVLGGECQECVHDETMRGANSDETG